MNSIKDYKNLNQKKVLLRLDLNVPLKQGLITDDTRIRKILPIIDFLIKKQTKIIIISHVGRPNGKIINDFSLKPICENLEKKLNKKIYLISNDVFKLKKDDLFKDPNNQIILKVIDQGQGLKEADTNKIFKRFYSNRPDTFGKHSGLGLNIVKNLVDLHGGTIKAANNINKKGANFEIIFPKMQ